MPTNKTSEEIARIRPAFDSNGRPGILESVVRAEHEKTWGIAVDLLKLKEIYIKFQCPGVVKLAEYLATDGAEIEEIGSGSIDLIGVTRGEFSINGALSLQELYIGSSDRKITPLQWLAYLANGLPGLLPEQIRVFDTLCDDLHSLATTAEVTRVDVF